MAPKPQIRRKPTAKKQDEAAVDKFLAANAEAIEATETKTPTAKPATKKYHEFRHAGPHDLFEELKAHLASMQLPTSQRSWINQAIVEKLKRDKGTD